jgi:enamine deaminase RidA (YjgF/YER057c/UK114 family)
MPGKIDARLAELGIVLPKATPPKVARIEGAMRWGDFLFVSGAVPKWDGEVRFVGKVGREFDLATGQAAARLSILNVLAQAKAMLAGDLDRIAQAVTLTAFVNATPDFTEIPQVANGASQVLLDVFGDAGRHARTAVGVAVMPFDVAIEVEAIFAVR